MEKMMTNQELMTNFQKMPAQVQKKETKLPEPVPAKHHSNLKTPQTFQKESLEASK